MHTADVVIVGAGIVSASIAYHLTAMGCRGVTVLERESQPGKGSTGKSMGGVRAQFATELNIRMSQYSIAFFRDFERTLGHPSGYRDHGYLFLATAPGHMEALERNARLQASLGVPVKMISPGDVERLVPLVKTSDVLGASYCPTDGFVDPYSVMNGFLQAALSAGATLLRSTEVTGVERDTHGVIGVATASGTIATRVVVNAAGAWASGVARLAGLPLPVTPLRRMLAPSEPFPGVPHRCPMVIDMTNGFHFRPEGAGVLMAWNDPEEMEQTTLRVDPDFVEKILARAVQRAPAFERLQVDPKRVWAGWYEMTPDHYPVLGPCAEVPGFYFANGFSGHGVMHSPATGRLLAEWILEGKPRLLDASPLRVERFASGELLEEPVVL